MKKIITLAIIAMFLLIPVGCVAAEQAVKPEAQVKAAPKVDPLDARIKAKIDALQSEIDAILDKTDQGKAFKAAADDRQQAIEYYRVANDEFNKANRVFVTQQKEDGEKVVELQMRQGALRELLK